jgi:hypothetical protein
LNGRYPNQVPELEGWVFIRGSEDPIARKVENYEPGRLRLIRYVADDGQFPQGQLAVARLYHGELPGAKTNERWQAWVIVVRGIDEYERPLVGPPDQRILSLMERFDTWARGRDPKHLQKFARHVREQRDKRAKETFRANMDEAIWKTVRKHQRDRGIKPHAFIPDNIPGTKG